MDGRSRSSQIQSHYYKENLFRFTGLFLSNRFRRNSLSHCCSENRRFKTRSLTRRWAQAITFQGVGKRFGSLDAVKNFSLEVGDGEIMGLLGPNGAGKTTLMLMMGTVYRPTSGKIRVQGYDVLEKPNSVRSIIGIAFQDPRFDGILNGYDVLDWHLKMTTSLGKEERKQRVEGILKALGLWEARGKRTWLMSGGMKKKIEDAKILAQRPKVAVFDEPTAFLDVPSRLLVWDMIRKLRDGGSTIIVATNMMDEEERLSDRVAIVNLGKLVAAGTPEQLKSTQKGGEVLEVAVESSHGLTADILTQFSEVHNVHVDENKVVVYLNSGRLLLPKIVETLTEQGFKIGSVHLKEVTLEDVFLTYTWQRLE